jgi:excisionase family DNA binding protein
MYDSPQLLTPERAAERLDLGRTKVYELIATGELESVKIGRARRVPADAIATYIKRLRDQPREAA